LFTEEPYLLAVLAHASGLSAKSEYFCRIYYDDNTDYSVEAFSSSSKSEKTYLHQTGFERVGMYNLVISPTVKEYIVLEFSLSGRGNLKFYDAQLVSMMAFESALSGRQIVTESQYSRIPENERSGLVVKPDNMWSLKGLKFLLINYIPIKQWLTPILSLSSYFILLLIATFAIAVIMRKQWLDRERYPMPLMRIPLSLLGEEETEKAVSPIWKNRIMWAGFAIALFWGLMRIWSKYNPDVPNLDVDLYLQPYLSSPQFGKMWMNVRFTLSGIFLSFAIFMELSVLISIVIGFFLFRSQFWIGYINGWVIDNAYPYGDHQQIGGFIAYGLLIIFFSRKYLWWVLKSAISGKGNQGAGDEVFSYRTALVILILSFAGIVLWSRWVEIPTGGMLLYFGLLLLVGFVSMKLRTECGTPFVFFVPMNFMWIVSMVGGMALFGPRGVIFAIIAALFVQNVFFLIPGLQLELLEIGKRFRIKARHIICICALGIIGGIVIGGWVFLSYTYALGGDNMTNITLYRDMGGRYKAYEPELSKADDKYIKKSTEETPFEIPPGTKAALFAAGLTGIVAVLRQLFAGFWFHPIGIVVGATQAAWETSMSGYIWGSCLLAFFIRYIVLKIGGAVTVRNKLLPFFVGFFLGTIMAYLVLAILLGYLYFFHPELERYMILFALQGRKGFLSARGAAQQVRVSPPTLWANCRLSR